MSIVVSAVRMGFIQIIQIRNQFERVRNDTHQTQWPTELGQSEWKEFK